MTAEGLPQEGLDAVLVAAASIRRAWDEVVRSALAGDVASVERSMLCVDAELKRLIGCVSRLRGTEQGRVATKIIGDLLDVADQYHTTLGTVQEAVAAELRSLDEQWQAVRRAAASLRRATNIPRCFDTRS